MIHSDRVDYWRAVGLPGSGFSGQTATSVISAGSAAASAAAPVLASSAVTAGLLTTAVAVPIVGAVIAGVSLALLAIFNNPRGAEKVAATHIVDAVEPQLKANRDAYVNAPVRTAAAQAAALQNFDYAWSQMTGPQYLGAASLKDVYRQSVDDRNRGGKWDWFSYYRDPVANTPPNDVAPQSAGLESSITGSLIRSATGVAVPETVLGIPLDLAAIALVITAFVIGDGR